MPRYVVLFKYARRLRDFNELSAGERPLGLGALKHIQSAVVSVFPSVVWTDTFPSARNRSSRR